MDYLVSKIPGVGKILDYGKSALDAHNLDSLEGGATRMERGKASYYREKYRGALHPTYFDKLSRILKETTTLPTPNDGIGIVEGMIGQLPVSAKWKGGATISERGIAGELRAKMLLNDIPGMAPRITFNNVIHDDNGFPLEGDLSNAFSHFSKIIDDIDAPRLSFRGDTAPTGRPTATADPPTADADAQPRGRGKKVAVSPTRSAPLSREEYLSRARAKAKAEGYPYKLLGYADDGKHKLQIPNKDGKIIRFGRQGYGDFIIWSAKEASGKVPEGFAKQKQNTFHSSHSKIKGRWRSDLFSPNMLALKILW